MRKHLLVLGFWVVGAVGMIAAPTALAEGEPITKVQSESPITDIPFLSEVEQPLTTAEGLLVQQPAPTPALAQVTGVQLKPTEKGLEVLLETAGEFPEVLTSSSENSLITDIPNAQLRLPKGGAFRRDNPSQAITSIEVTNLDAKTIRVTVTGKAGVPTAEVSQSPQALILSVVAPPAPAPVAPPVQPTPAPAEPPQPEAAPEAPAPEPQAEGEKLLELEVRAEEEAGEYNVPDASTATRTDTPILDIPASIQVIPQQVLEDQQDTNIVDALANVSGVSADSDRGVLTEINIRGFTNAPILLDGFRLFGSTTPEETANLERVEVLRGPASILFGEVQPGGVVNLVTKKPTAEPFYNIEFQAGSFGLFRPQVDLSGPLTDDRRLLYRLNAVYNREDGFRDFDTDYERFFIAPVVTWKISDRTDLTIMLDYLDEKQPFDSGLVASPDGVLDIPYDRITNEPDDINRRKFLNLGYSLEHRFSDNWRLRNAFRYTEQDYSVDTAIPLEFDPATNIVTRFYAAQDQDVKSYSLQTNVVGEFATGAINHTLLAGTDLNLSRNKDSTLLDFTPLPLNILDPEYGTVPRPDREDLTFLFGEDSQTKRLGIYLQDQIDFGNVILLAGLRYDTVGTEDSLNDTEGNSDAISPRVGIVYQPIEPLSLYASYSRSFTPSFEPNAAGDLLEPERGEGFEVGVKTELLEGRLFTSLGYFNITRQNVATPDPDVLGASVATGRQSSQGFEFDVRGEILPGWNLLASYSYIDAEVTEDIEVPVGNELPGVPRNSANLWTTYKIQSGDLQGLGFGLGFNFAGQRAGDRANTFEVDSYFIPNAAVFYERDNWRAALNFRNIFNVKYIQGTPTDTTTGIEPGDPFTVIGSVSVRF